MHPELENLITMALADGVVTEKEREIILRKAESLGIDKDEIEMILDGKIAELQNNKSNVSKKEGDLKKCPSCGASVPSFQMNCSECGHEFRNTESSNCVMELEKKLNSVKKFEQKAEIMHSHIIPNTKEDLFEMLAYTSGKVISYSDFDSTEDYFISACRARSIEIITKLKFMPGLDSHLQLQIVSIEKKIMTQKRNKSLKLIGLYIGIAGFGILIYWLIYLAIKSFF